ncbi:MAG: cysteine desulfurase NifS [Clostridia bacterium]|nr:cysteine desulfurase NifS [Clostridia bacterium]
MDIRYFDNSATTKIKEEVLKEMFPYLSIQYGNPSSIYSIGRNAKRAVEEARKRVAAIINCRPEEIYFTSCGSESDNTALKGIAYANKEKGKHIITSKIEHPAILNTCENLQKHGFEVSYVGVNKDGIINLEELKNLIRKDTVLISIMFANNEIGTIQPIEEIAKIAHKNNILFHTDAVQAVGNIPIDVEKMGIDMLSLSGHKIYAPKGIGALYIKKGIEFERFMDGGHQEKNKRAGTENVAQIVGLGKACQIANQDLENYQEKLRGLRNYCLEKIKENIPNIHINGTMEKRLPGNINISFKGIDSNELLFRLDEFGICASGGSACSSGDNSPSHVLTAIGTPSELEKSAIRFTFGDFNTKEDVDYLVKVLSEIIKEPIDLH